MARNEMARERAEEDSLLDRRGYLKLASAAAASVTALGTGGAASASTDDDTLLYEDFGDDTYTDHFTDTLVQGQYDDIVSDFAKEGSNSLRAQLPQGSHYGIAATFDPVEAGAVNDELNEMYASYWLRLSPDFEPHPYAASKFPGPGNTEDGTGNGGDRATGTGWSARAGFQGDGNGGVKIGYYSYHMDMGGSYGENIWATTIPRGQWVKVEQYVKLNSVSNGSANSDGVLKMWVDGDLHIDRNGMRFTEQPDTFGCNYKFVVRFGGSDTSPRNQNVCIDGWTVRRTMPSDSTDDTTTSEPSEEQEGELLELVTDDSVSRGSYDFTVEGSVTKNTGTGDNVSEGNDSIVDNGDGTMTVSGIAGEGYGDSYYVDGTIVSMNIDETKWTLRHEGTEVNVSDIVFPNKLVIDGSNAPRRASTYEFTVSGSATKSAQLGSVNSYDTISDGTISGRIIGGKDGFRFSGEITNFTLDGPANVRVENA